MAEIEQHPQSAAGATAVHAQLPLHFIKSSQFRVVYAVGAWYGGDAQGNLHLTFFNERVPIPKKVFLNLNEKGEILDEDLSKREVRQGFVREMEVDVVFSIDAAIHFYKALGQNLEAIKKLQASKP